MIFILIPLVYLLIGTFIARATYRPLSNERLDKLRLGEHKKHCWWGSNYGKSWRTAHCDCGLVPRSDTLSVRRDVFNPYIVLFAYPAIGFHKFLTSGGGTKSKVDHGLISRLEKELEIGGNG